MKSTQKFITIFALFSAIFFLSFSSAKAEVFGHVQNKDIGFVLDQVVSNDGKYIYMTAVGEVLVYSRNPDTGEVLDKVQTLNEGNIILGTTLSFSPEDVTSSPDGSQIYVSAGFGIPSDDDFPSESSVVAFNINDDGSLTYKNRAITNNTESSMVMTSDGKYMYVGGTSSEITTLRRAANGNLSVVGSFKNTDLHGIEFDNLDKLLVSPDNKTLYASTTFNDGHMHVFSINQSTGALTNIQTLEHAELDNPPYQHAEHTQSQGVGGEGIAISSDGKFLYTIPSYYSSNTIGIFNRNTDGTLEFKAYVQAPQSHVGTLSVAFSPNDIRLSPNQKFIYVLDSNIGNIAVWERNISSGDLTYIGAMNNKNSSANFTGGAGERISFSKDDIFLYTNTQRGLLVFDLRADLDIVKSAPSSEVAPNGTISYTLAVTNIGPSDATNVVVTDNLPVGTSYVGGTVNSASGSCTASGQTVTCDMGKFVVGDGYNAIIQLKAPATEGIITNTASVTSDQLDTETANNTDSADATIKEGGSALPPVDDGTSGGGSLPLSLVVLLIPALLRRIHRNFKVRS